MIRRLKIVMFVAILTPFLIVYVVSFVFILDWIITGHGIVDRIFQGEELINKLCDE